MLNELQGCTYFGAFVWIIALQRWPGLRQHASVLGLLMAVASLVTASFATRSFHLVITQGAMYGIGGALLYSPLIFYLDEWFERRKGLAYGVSWAGTGVGGSFLPLVIEWSLKRYGFRVTLRAWAVLLVSRKTLNSLMHESLLQMMNFSSLS